MPHVTFGEEISTRGSYDEGRAVIRVTKKKEDEKDAVVLRESRTIGYKIPEAKPCQPAKPVHKTCIERKITYKDSKGNIVKITCEDSCGRVTKTIYPNLPPAPLKECCPPSPPPKCESPPSSEPSNVRSEEARNYNWTKTFVKNSRGVVRKIVHVDCYGKTMKTEYPETGPPKRRSIETKRYVIRGVDDSPSRRRYSETKKLAINKEVCEPTPKPSSETIKTEKQCKIRSTVKSGDDSRRSDEYFDFFPPQGCAIESSTTSRRDLVAISSSKRSGESDREVIEDENGVTNKVIYTDSRDRRRTVVYNE
jgi:hypothetical protein